MDTGKADRNAAYKKYKFFNRECKQGRSLFFLSVVLSGAVLSIGAGLTGCSQKDAPVPEPAETENYDLSVFTAQEPEYKASEIGKGYTLAHIEKTQKKMKYNSISKNYGNTLKPQDGGLHL